MNSSIGPFGKFPKAIADSGILARLRRSELSTLLVLVAHTNGRTLESYPSIETIMKPTGLSERTVQRALKGLGEKKVIDIDTGGGRGRTSRYRLRENPVIIGDTVSDPKPRHLGDTVSSVKGVILDPKPRHLGDTRTEEQKERCAGASGKTKSSKGESPHQSLIEYFGTRWSELIGGGGKYPFAQGRDAKAAKTILEAVTGDLRRGKQMIDAYLTDDDSWLVENGEGRGLALLASRARLAKYIVATAIRNPQGRADGDSAPTEHPLIADARAKWPDDVASHPEEWRALAMAVETGRIPGNSVIVTDSKTAEEFRAQHTQEPTRVAK